MKLIPVIKLDWADGDEPEIFRTSNEEDMAAMVSILRTIHEIPTFTIGYSTPEEWKEFCYRHGLDAISGGNRVASSNVSGDTGAQEGAGE